MRSSGAARAVGFVLPLKINFPKSTLSKAVLGLQPHRTVTASTVLLPSPLTL